MTGIINTPIGMQGGLNLPQQRPSFGRRLLGAVGSAASGVASFINPLLGLGVGALQGVLNRRTSVRNMRLQNRWRREAAEYEWSKNLEMWNRVNQYNLPSAQMKRFKDAGLNPNLIYKQGTAGNATMMPKYQRPTLNRNIQPLNIAGMLQTHQDLQMRQAQISNIEAQTKRTQVQTVHEGYKQVLTQSNNALRKQQINNLAEQFKGIEHDNVYKQFKANLATQGFTVTDPKLLRVTYTWLKENGYNPDEMLGSAIKKVMDFISGKSYEGYQDYLKGQLPAWLRW